MAAGGNNKLASGYGGSAQWVPPFQLVDENAAVKFAVAADGTLTTSASLINAASAYTFQSTLEVDGNFTVNTNKFSVTASSGNASFAGTLGVTGALTVTAVKPILGASANTPASAGAAGTAGMVCWDSGFIYVCTATNTWKSVAISTF